MDKLNPFDKHLESRKNDIPPLIRDAAIHVHDTMELAEALAKSTCKGSVKPEHAIEIYDRIQAEWLRRLAEVPPEDRFKRPDKVD